MTGPPPPAVVAAGPAPPSVDALAGRWTEVRSVPADPFSLHHRRLAWPTRVASRADAVAVLDAAGRGVAVVVHLALAGPDAEAFLDDLSRVAVLAEAGGRSSPPVVDRLSADQRALLAALAVGRPLVEAAADAGFSRRTALRRLAAARAVLGVASTTEAVVLVAGASPPGG